MVMHRWRGQKIKKTKQEEKKKKSALHLVDLAFSEQNLIDWLTSFGAILSQCNSQGFQPQRKWIQFMVHCTGIKQIFSLRHFISSAVIL